MRISFSMKAVTPKRKMNKFDAFRNMLTSKMRYMSIVDEGDIQEERKYDEETIEMVSFVFRDKMPPVLKGWALDFFKDVYRPRLKFALAEALEAISGIYEAMGKK